MDHSMGVICNVHELYSRNGSCYLNKQKGRKIQKTVAYHSCYNDSRSAIRIVNVYVAASCRPRAYKQLVVKVGLDR